MSDDTATDEENQPPKRRKVVAALLLRDPRRARWHMHMSPPLQSMQRQAGDEDEKRSSGRSQGPRGANAPRKKPMTTPRRYGERKHHEKTAPPMDRAQLSKRCVAQFPIARCSASELLPHRVNCAPCQFRDEGKLSALAAMYKDIDDYELAIV